MKNKSNVFMVLLVLNVVFVMTGCNKLEKAKENIANDDSYSSKIEEKDKYNVYVDLFSVLSGELAKIEHSYAQKHMDGDGQFVPTDDKTALGYIGVIGSVQRAIEEAEKRLSTKPKMTIDEDVKPLLTVLKKEVLILEEIESYYQEKDFLNDHDEKGKELNSKLVLITKEMNDPIKNFSDNMRTFMSETEKKEREAHKKEGNKISLGMLEFLDTAKEARDVVSNSVAEEGRIDLTTENFVGVNIDVSKALYELKKIPTDSKDIEKEGFSSATSSIYIDRFIEKASEFKSLSNELAASFGGDEEALIDVMKKLSNGYSELIDVYNKI
ncbi:DUF3829 domain-containing protein [Enterococcus plantarum]|uniref:DUF3829 domain-containing protein n=1 Tax=Enterococcus plantarum TaxID=1077675 RepID=UPI001A8C1391|nr:DUF3829 domain-containing protein [Enterococcus plantarum]MBO0422042.1 DUF3829 domain-containing protein [Enterococcus plantarum]